MQKYNWNLTRIGLCKHRKGKEYFVGKNGVVKKRKHTNDYVVQVWMGNPENTMDTGWACNHEKNVVEDKIAIERYLKRKKADMLLKYK